MGWRSMESWLGFTMHALTLLMHLGVDPDSAEVKSAIEKVEHNITWQGDEAFEGNPYFKGEIEPCINGQVARAAAYFGYDCISIIDQLLSMQLVDGGWNCDACSGSIHSSFHTTICVLEAVLEYELHFSKNSDLSRAREKGEDYLLKSQLCKHKSTRMPITVDRKTGECSDKPVFTNLAFPCWWHYDILRGLDYFRRSGSAPDQSMQEAVNIIADKQRSDGTWAADVIYPGKVDIPIQAIPGRTDKWITFYAMRVLRWYYQ